MGKNKPQTLKGLDSLGALFNIEAGPDNDSPTEPHEEVQEIDPSMIDLRVALDRKNRNGKAVTLITGFGDLHEDDLKDLAKMLKSKCGVGGSAKEGEIVIQGDHVLKVMDILRMEGFKVKRTGG